MFKRDEPLATTLQVVTMKWSKKIKQIQTQKVLVHLENFQKVNLFTQYLTLKTRHILF